MLNKFYELNIAYYLFGIIMFAVSNFMIKIDFISFIINYLFELLYYIKIRILREKLFQQ